MNSITFYIVLGILKSAVDLLLLLAVDNGMEKVTLTEDDVLSVAGEINLTEDSTLTAGELMNCVKEFILYRTNLDENDVSKWVQSGVDGRVLLEAGGGWRKGKLRLRVEFIPDSQVSPLDDLRKNL